MRIIEVVVASCKFLSDCGSNAAFAHHGSSSQLCHASTRTICRDDSQSQPEVTDRPSWWWHCNGSYQSGGFQALRDRPGPFNPSTKMRHVIIEQGQSPLQHSFDGKPLSLQPFPNSLASDVTRHHPLEAVTLKNNPTLPGFEPADPDLNILESYEGIHKFPQQIVRISAKPISLQSRPETKSPTQTKDSQF